MSIEALNWALDDKLDKPALKAVLIGIANHANPQGEAWPSKQRLALYTGYSERQVQRAIQELEALDLLEVIERNGRSNLFLMKHLINRGDMVSPGGRQGVSGGETGCLPNHKEPPIQSLSQAKTKRLHRLPDDWQPSMGLLAWAQDNHPLIEVHHEAAQFRDYWLASGGTKLDWDAAFRTWVRRARPMGATRSHAARHSPADLVAANRDKLSRVLGNVAGDAPHAPAQLIEGERVR